MTSMRKTLLCILVAGIYFASPAQTLFTYGNHSVSKAEFLKAFNKNNAEARPTEKTYRDYLELYIRFKLKVQEALVRKLDTLPNQVTELQSFRNQVVDNFMNDDASLNALVEEAAARSREDIHIAHIWVQVPASAPEAAWKAAEEKINKAYSALEKGQDFGSVAVQYSSDPSVSSNKGDIGYITAFVLPYDLETIAYTTAPGKYSRIYKSNIGYHIIRNLGKRKAQGKIRVAQILLALPPGATAIQKESKAKLADSLYKAIQSGADFAKLAAAYSNDNLSYQAGGEIPEFGVGKYDPLFEATAFGIEKDGEVARPIATEYGYHIIKRLGRSAIPPANDESFRAFLKQQVLQSDRMEVARQALGRKVQNLAAFRRLPYNQQWLWEFTDSVLKNKSASRSKPGFSPKTGLFTFGKQTYTVADWQTYLESIRNQESMTSGKTKAQLLDGFVVKCGTEYYRNHLEQFNKDFAYQLQEFKEGNLLFEVMQRKVWDVASTDSVGLKKYYDAHKGNYWWESSADAIILTCSNDSIAVSAKKRLGADISAWRTLVNQGDGTVQGDSGRFELSQIPVPEKTKFITGAFTPNVVNESDRSSSFAYIVIIYKERQPRNFNDARGFVINDYQTFLEEKWVEELKKKYPVKVNEVVLKSIH